MSPSKIQRRRLLKGILAGSVVTVGLPILDCLLNSNGDAFADTGSPLPVRFGTWFWGLGLSKGYWEPKATGQNYELRPQLRVLETFKDRMNIISGTQVFLDGRVVLTHFSGAEANMTGTVTTTEEEYSTSLDSIIGEVIGKQTRFRSLEVACDQNRKSTWSARGANGLNPAEISPAALYTRIFGAGYTDPNSATFVPSPDVMVRKSSLSAVMEERRELLKDVGTEDRRRLDQYFSSVRDLEQQLSIQLQKPAPLQACSKSDPVKDAQAGTIVDDALANHNLFAKLLAHALACDQTRVFNISISQGMSGLRRPGDTTNHHIYTHEERDDPQLGYQRISAWFAERYMASFRDLMAEMDGIREGDRTLLDRTLIFAFTDHGDARVHGLLDYPFFLAGRAGGRMKTGFHVSAIGQPTARVGFTAQQIMGVQTGSWGTGSNHVSTPFTELMA
jgi:hypothetical protein